MSVNLIDQQQIIPPLWEEHRREHGDDLLYIALSEFARHLLVLQQTKQTNDFPAVAIVIERLHLEGDPSVREAATIGLLEGIQNVWSHSIDPEIFAAYLLPESARWWQSLNDFWTGKAKFVGEGM
jgi:hypothetical protein